ncbi:hypothetical protein [Reichenbachiella sp. MALMAid0571]|uniref:hypothetical protein n=1 Tax=Reichenbachiella sp. MALMAid0571 TaxID=3143939 RepID=UPI0032DEFC45
MTGGAGFARDSRSNQEKNLRYLDKFSAGHFKKTYYKTTKVKRYRHKETTPEQLKEIKDSMRTEARQFRQKSGMLLIAVIILTTISMLLIFI